MIFIVACLTACDQPQAIEVIEPDSLIAGDAAESVELVGYRPSSVVLWNEVALAAVRNDPSKPTVITRSMFMLHMAMFDAWAVYDDTAMPVELIEGLRRVPADRSVENKQAAASQAAFHMLVYLFPDFEADTGSFETMLRLQGYEPDFEVSKPLAPSDIGLLAFEAVSNARKFDGSNQENDYEDMTTADFPTLYRPVNAPADNLPGSPYFIADRWQPLRVPTGTVLDKLGNPMIDLEDTDSYSDQIFTTPHWGSVVPFALTAGDQFQPPAPPIPGSTEPYLDARGNMGTGDEIYKMQVAEVLNMSANLTDEQKVIAEYWADGPRSETPPGHWNALGHGISERDTHTLDEDIKFYFALNCALFDAGIAAWEAKRTFDYVRPVSAIQHEYAGQLIEAWAGPNQGTQLIKAEDWKPYQQADFVTPPFSEYVSGHSTFSAAAAEVFTQFTGSSRYYDGETVLYYSDFNADGIPDMLGEHIVPVNGNLFEKSPSKVVVLRWDSFQDAADEAGLSRLYGGIHFTEGDLNGRIMGRAIGNQAYKKAAAYWINES